MTSNGRRDDPQSQSTKPIWLRVFRISVAITVVAALAIMISSTWSQLTATDFRMRDVEARFWLFAVVVYVGAMFLACLFWHRVMIAFGQNPSLGRSMLAFFASQLGKYVPGKAMVVVIRTDIIRSSEVKTGPAAASVFVETLTWIFVGSAIASLLLAFRFRGHSALQFTAVALTLLAGVLTWPAVFRKIASAITSRKLAETSFLSGLSLNTMAFGWIVMSLGWCLNGLSLWLVIRGIPASGIGIGDFPLTLACVSLATVAGFVSLLPGGLGVRELVMIPLLGTRFGPVTAIISAIAIRFVWLASELLSSGIIYVWRKRVGRIGDSGP